MTIADPLLDILCCPVSHQPLRPLEKSRLKKLADRIATGEVLYVDHNVVDEKPREALITRDDKVIYLVVDGIPVLLPDRGIGTAQFTDPI
ncbi:MAG TPA: Trm112 family protein [Wenzhouxiangella sp.]|nr:Trm112 family protein [Wenzhouxiangella sp.]